MRTTRWMFVLLVAAIGLNGCSSSPKAARVSDVVGGRAITADPSRFSPDLPSDAIVIEATVADVRLGENLLVELSDGQEQIWVSGFTDAPARASVVLTALLDGAQPHDVLGSVYPSSGALDPDDVVSGFTERGALAVIVGVALGLVLLVPVVAPMLGHFRAGRNCPECQRRLALTWRTCPRCGRAQDLPQGLTSAGPPVREPPESAPNATIPPLSENLPDAPLTTERPTRIVRGD